MEAPDRGAVVERLQRQGHLVLRADPADGRRGLRELLQIELGSARGPDKAAFGEVTREHAIMLAAGQGLDGALCFVVDNTRSARAILGNVRDKVRGGSSLVLLLDYVPPQFTPIFGQAGAELPSRPAL